MSKLVFFFRGHQFSKSCIKIFIALILLALVLWLSGVKAVFSRLTHFPPLALVSMLLLLSANLWLVSFRLWRVLAHFGIKVPWGVVSRASLAGHAAALFMISLFGQVAGRQSIIGKYNITPVVSASIAGYERALLAIISGTLAFLGACYLLGRNTATSYFNSIPIMEIIFLIILSIIYSLWLGMSRLEASLSNRMLTKQNLFRFGWIAVLTATCQVMILSSFVIGIKALYPQISLLQAFAASAMISFAASLPISIGGWGVRELTSVFVLGKMGIPPSDAVSLSIIFGICATLIILIFSCFLIIKPKHRLYKCQNHSIVGNSFLEIEQTSAWLLGMAVAVAIFFQFHAVLPSGVLNINLADPFAILALSAVSLHALLLKETPRWRIPEFNRIILIFTALIIFGAFVGWLKIGVTQWVLGGRLIGWLVLMGYLSAGYLLSSIGGAKGARRMSETLAATAVIVVIWQAVDRILYMKGWNVTTPTLNFEGYSANRNAFAFQLMAVVSLLLAYSRIYAKIKKGVFRIALLLGIVLAGVVWSGSRAGMLTAFILILFTGFTGIVPRRIIIPSLLIVSLILGGVKIVQSVPIHSGPVQSGPVQSGPVQSGPVQSGPVQSGPVQSSFSGEASNQERLQTWSFAIKMWRESPFIGDGLGYFWVKSAGWMGRQTVIHSTPLWILAEFGLLGFVVIIWASWKLFKFVLPKTIPPSKHGMIPVRTALLLLLVMFTIFSLFHELLYQRILWMVFGALLARPGSAGANAKSITPSLCSE